MKRILLLFAPVAICLAAFGLNASAYSSVDGYSSVSYDSATNTVTGISYTSQAYGADLYYQPYDSVYIALEDGSQIAGGDGFSTEEDPRADVYLQVTGNGCQFYQIVGQHWVRAYYYVTNYYDHGVYLTGYLDDDDYNYYFREQVQNTFIGSYTFTGQGPSRAAETVFMFLGSTVDWSSGTCNLPPKVSKIQYKGPNNSSFSDASSTLYVLKDTAVTFKAIPNPSNVTFPSGQPVWSGSSGASGTGDTITVTFSTVSSNTSDFKTVVATTTSSSPSSSQTINVIVYSLTGTLTPQDNFTGRNADKYGLLEKVNLAFTTTPSISAGNAGGLTWKITSGQGTLNNTTTGSDTFIAPKTAGAVTLKLEIQNGPSKQLGTQSNKTVVAPTGAYMIKSPDVPSLTHCNGYSSVGFFGEVRLEPRDISFSNLYFREGTGKATATGFYISEDGRNHDPTDFMTPVTNCNITSGCKAFIDQVYTGKWPADPQLGFYYGDFRWPIKWLYAFANDLDPVFNGQVEFTTAIHYQESNNIGTASISKAGAGPFSRLVGDPDNGCD